MSNKKRLNIEEAQDAATKAQEAWLVVHALFQPCSDGYPRGHGVAKTYRRAWGRVQDLRDALELEVERLVREGGKCRDDCWWMVHPTLRPKEFQYQEHPGGSH